MAQEEYKLKTAVSKGDLKATKRLIKGGTNVNKIFGENNWVFVRVSR